MNFLKKLSIFFIILFFLFFNSDVFGMLRAILGIPLDQLPALETSVAELNNIFDLNIREEDKQEILSFIDDVIQNFQGDPCVLEKPIKELLLKLARNRYPNNYEKRFMYIEALKIYLINNI